MIVFFGAAVIFGCHLWILSYPEISRREKYYTRGKVLWHFSAINSPNDQRDRKIEGRCPPCNMRIEFDSGEPAVCKKCSNNYGSDGEYNAVKNTVITDAIFDWNNEKNGFIYVKRWRYWIWPSAFSVPLCLVALAFLCKPSTKHGELQLPPPNQIAAKSIETMLSVRDINVNIGAMNEKKRLVTWENIDYMPSATQVMINSPGGKQSAGSEGIPSSDLRRIEDHLQFVNRGGDSSPYLLPHLDPDMTRLFAHNSSTYSAHVLYRQIDGIAYGTDGSSLSVHVVDSKQVEIAATDFLWLMDFPTGNLFNKARLHFSGKARNGPFSNTIEIYMKDGRLACSWIEGPDSADHDERCP